MNISRAEQETIISFSEEGKEAYIYTYKPSYIRQLEKLCLESPEDFKKGRVDHGGHNYIIPKRYIKIIKPLSKDQKQKKLENFKKNLTE